MPSKKNPQLVLYPEYFDSKLTRHEGRRVTKRQAVSEPNVEELASAAKRAGFEITTELNASYPRFWWKKRGRVLVEPEKTKSEVVKKVAQELASGRRINH